MPADTDFRRQLRTINESGADGIVLWGDAAAAGEILKQMREMGLKQPVFGSFRVIGDDLLRIAGSAAEGLEAVFPFDPTRDDPAWLAFQQRFEKRFGKQPEVFASLAYDTVNILLQAICRAGLNRGRIRDALTGLEQYRGVTGEMVFDPNVKNIVPLYLATVKRGKYEFRRYPMQAPYAKVGENPVNYNGPPLGDAPAGPARIALFGPGRSLTVAAQNQPYTVTGISSDQPWGKASADLVKLIYDEHALAIVAVGRNSSHLAEQLAVKAFVPVIVISDDRRLTSVNIPWVFRLPAATSVADAFRCLADAIERAGANRGRLRDVLASGTLLGGGLRFQSTGEPY
jgi:hypothetical protein